MSKKRRSGVDGVGRCAPLSVLLFCEPVRKKRKRERTTRDQMERANDLHHLHYLHPPLLERPQLPLSKRYRGASVSFGIIIIILKLVEQ